MAEKFTLASAALDEAQAVETLFTPFRFGTLDLPNRIVMSPMNRYFAPKGVPSDGMRDYYRRRAEGGVGLIFAGGIQVAHHASGDQLLCARLDSDESINAWARIVSDVHAAGGRIAAQLWHVGLHPSKQDMINADVQLMGPSGIDIYGQKTSEPMSLRDIDEIIEGYGFSAAAAKRIGFDGIEVHAAHGYLIDQFFWDRTNHRVDKYGGDLAGRTRFCVEVIEECRSRVGPDFPVAVRFSQFKTGAYTARLAQSPSELARFLEPLADTSVDLFDCSQRRFWEPEFEGSDLNLAGWTKKLTGKPAMAVGSVTYHTDAIDRDTVAQPEANIGRLVQMMDRGDFDLIAVGRAIIANPTWPDIIKRGAFDELKTFLRKEANETIY